jgi:hypothetical protein
LVTNFISSADTGVASDASNNKLNNNTTILFTCMLSSDSVPGISVTLLAGGTEMLSRVFHSYYSQVIFINYNCVKTI